MSCVITYKGNKYTQEQFKEYISSNKNEFSHIIASNKSVINSFKRKMESVDYVFNQSPELASIGSKAQYLQYLSTIFKTSKAKDIVYHGTSELFETFDKLKQVSPGFYFTPNSKSAYFGRNDIIYAVILNVKNPISNYKEITEIAEQGTLDAFIEKNYDGIVELQEKEEIIVFEPEQIHILGSKQDIEGFKAFVESNNTKTNNSESIDKNAESEIKPIVDAENKTIKNNYEIFKEVQGFFDSNLSTMDNIYNAIFNNSEITSDDIIKQIIKTDNVEKECNGGMSDSNWEIV